MCVPEKNYQNVHTNPTHNRPNWTQSKYHWKQNTYIDYIQSQNRMPCGITDKLSAANQNPLYEFQEHII